MDGEPALNEASRTGIRRGASEISLGFEFDLERVFELLLRQLAK